jgi:hypothetical protein
MDFAGVLTREGRGREGPDSEVAVKAHALVGGGHTTEAGQACRVINVRRQQKRTDARHPYDDSYAARP